MTCPLCNEDIADNQSRVCVLMSSPGTGPLDVRYCHRKCASERWPDRYTWHPQPTGPLL